MTAFEFVKTLEKEWKCVPMVMHGNKPIRASNGQIKRWLNMGAISINNKRVKETEMIEFPIKEMTFFPKNKNRCSIA